ncbi:hypothetical protein ACFSC4_21125 [Deinococcus malanensis]|uniref:hypothetical protein n=1 Tax=Deinococcus malanensis TaxID=1706855 RepID=UPI0036295DCC
MGTPQALIVLMQNHLNVASGAVRSGLTGTDHQLHESGKWKKPRSGRAFSNYRVVMTNAFPVR